MIKVSQLTKEYGAVRAVDDLTFDVEPGRVTGFLGPNGAGKSTTDLLCRAGRHEEARRQFLEAAALTKNGRERSTMQARAAECAAGHLPS